MHAVDLISAQIERSEQQGVELLCCPEAITGGLAHESGVQSPEDVALSVQHPRIACGLDLRCLAEFHRGMTPSADDLITEFCTKWSSPDPDELAAYFTEDAVYPGLSPHSTGSTSTCTGWSATEPWR